jgi:hypothetical protein
VGQVNQPDIGVPADASAAGITLVSAAQPMIAGVLIEIVGGEGELIKELLPFSVVLLNGSSKRVLATSVNFEWTNAQGDHTNRYFVLTSYDGVYALEPGRGRLFVLQRRLNTYFAKPADARGVMPPDYSSLISAISADLAGVTNLKINVAGVVFDDFSFVGSEPIFRRLRADRPEIHR